MYGDSTLTDKTGTPMRGNIAIDPMGGHEGQMFKKALEDKFNPESLSTVNADYHLTVVIAKTLIPSVVKSDGTIQRYEIRFNSSFNLFKAGHKKPQFTGTLMRSGSYNVAVNANFATYEAEQDVIERILQELAEDYVFRISGYLAAPHPDVPDDDDKAVNRTPVQTPSQPPAAPNPVPVAAPAPIGAQP